MELHSNAFAQNGDIPSVLTCDGRDVSLPLAWSGFPAGARSLALIVDDPDAPDPAAGCLPARRKALTIGRDAQPLDAPPRRSITLCQVGILEQRR